MVTATPTISTPVGPVPTQSQILRDRIRVDPRRGLHTLHHAPGLDAVTTQILMAEAYQRLGQHEFAHHVAGQAVAAVSRADIPRLLAARAVLADVACRLGGPAALTACHDYAHLAVRQTDPARILLAGAVYAVTSFNDLNCAEGRTRLTRLLQLTKNSEHRHHPVATAIFHAYTTMNHICRHHRHPEPAEPDPLPGGLLTTNLTQLTLAALTHLLRDTTVTHRCARGRR